MLCVCVCVRTCLHGTQARRRATQSLPADYFTETKLKLIIRHTINRPPVVTSAGQHQLIPREHPALVLKGEPTGLSFKVEIFGPHSILMEGSEILKNPLGSSRLSLMVPPLVLRHSSRGIWDGRLGGRTQTQWQLGHVDEDRASRTVTLAAVQQKGRFVLCW